jgi:hypothetical protein
MPLQLRKWRKGHEMYGGPYLVGILFSRRRGPGSILPGTLCCMLGRCVEGREDGSTPKTVVLSAEAWVFLGACWKCRILAPPQTSWVKIYIWIRSPGDFQAPWNLRNFRIDQWLYTRSDVAPTGDICQCLGTFLVVATGEEEVDDALD